MKPKSRTTQTTSRESLPEIVLPLLLLQISSWFQTRTLPVIELVWSQKAQGTRNSSSANLNRSCRKIRSVKLVRRAALPVLKSSKQLSNCCRANQEHVLIWKSIKQVLLNKPKKKVFTNKMLWRQQQLLSQFRPSRTEPQPFRFTVHAAGAASTSRYRTLTAQNAAARKTHQIEALEIKYRNKVGRRNSRRKTITRLLTWKSGGRRRSIGVV